MDDKIVALIRSQPDEGLKLLQQQYSGMMRYIVGNILRNQEDAEECISDICMKVWRSIDGYSAEKSRFSTWLTVIARNTALNYLNHKHNIHADKHMKYTDLETHPPGTSAPFSAASPEEAVFRQERAEALKFALSLLSAEERHLFYRKYYYLQQTAQIAAELGMTERSVEGKLYRLRKKLQKNLGGDFT